MNLCKSMTILRQYVQNLATISQRKRKYMPYNIMKPRARVKQEARMQPHRYKYKYRYICIDTDTFKTVESTEWQAGRPTDTQVDRQTDGPTDGIRAVLMIIMRFSGGVLHDDEVQMRWTELNCRLAMMGRSEMADGRWNATPFEAATYACHVAIMNENGRLIAKWNSQAITKKKQQQQWRWRRNGGKKDTKVSARCV